MASPQTWRRPDRDFERAESEARHGGGRSLRRGPCPDDKQRILPEL